MFFKNTIVFCWFDKNQILCFAKIGNYQENQKLSLIKERKNTRILSKKFGSARVTFQKARVEKKLAKRAYRFYSSRQTHMYP